MFLVGPNGSGKSNFLDALRFVADALSRSLDQAVRERGGIKEVRRRSSGHPRNFAIALEFDLDGASGEYAFEIAALEGGGFRVKRERCRLARGALRVAEFELADGDVRAYAPGLPPAAEPDRLFLVHAAGAPAFRPVYDALSRMGFYSLDPHAMRRPQPPESGEILTRDGANVASVLERLRSQAPQARDAIVEFLGKVVPGIVDISRVPVAGLDTLEFRQDVGADHPWKFYAAQMSDGTVRALGVLVALFQVLRTDARIPLIAIEEPEIALHPAATEILVDCLREASHSTQVLVTSHSTDLLDDASIQESELLAVVALHNETRIGRVDPPARDALRDQLYSAGELLRMDQLKPAYIDDRPRQMDLFSGDR